jgi:MarR family transcriptional regulator, organic hydroperoxide resistance regulator
MGRMCPRSKNPSCEAWQLLVRFSFTQRATLPALAAELELSPAQCHLLNLIDPDRPLPMGELAGAMSCDASNVTGLVDRLELRGLLQRRPSDEDRRVKVLSLTPLGKKVRGALLERMTSSPPTLERLSEADQRALARILRRLLD